MPTAEQWIQTLQLQPHPEGGWYREVYRSTRSAPVDRMGAIRCEATSIYFLLAAGQRSALHRIRQDELWHFHDGDGLAVHQISPTGEHRTWPLGRDLVAGQRPQACVPAGHWFGAELVDGGAYALVGCTVAPGFEFEDLEMAGRADLQKQFPRHAELIERLTVDP